MPVISSCWSTVTWSASSCWRSSVARNAPRQFTSTSATSRGSAERSPTWPRDDGSRRFKDVAAMPPDGLSTTQAPGAIGPSHRVRLPTVEDTQAWGARPGALLQAGDLVVLTGGLGAGKTSLTQGIAAGLGVRLSLIHISEPTRLGMISYAVFCLK